MRRLHPLSAVVRIGRGLLQGAFYGLVIGTTLAGVLGIPTWAIPLLVPVGAFLVGGFALARYYRFTYEIEGDTLAVESGVLSRKSREIPLGRIQNVDVTQGVVNRLLGLSVVAFETAGGSATEATLDAVDAAEADRLRRLIRRHSERRDPSETAAAAAADRPALEQATPGEPGPTRERPEALFAFDMRDLLLYALVSVRPAAPALLLIGLPLGVDALQAVLQFNLGLVGSETALTATALSAFGPPQLLGLVLLTLLQFLVAALALSVGLTIVEYYQFRLVRDGTDLRYQRGLLRRYSGTIPLSKVQTVSIRENAAMRRLGMATLVVETAGYSGGNGESTQGVAIPMAPRETVYELAREIEPFDDLAFERAPTRARRRYAARFAIAVSVVVATGYVADTYLLQSGYWWLLLGLFAFVPPAAHLRWRHRGVALSEDVLATRTGFWRRTTRVVPYYRLQTVFVGRSLFQRRRDLATITADTASTSSVFGGSATAYDLDRARAEELRDLLRERLYSDLLARKAERDSPAE